MSRCIVECTKIMCQHRGEMLLPGLQARSAEGSPWSGFARNRPLMDELELNSPVLADREARSAGLAGRTNKKAPPMRGFFSIYSAID
jgi:hypothetical protein